MGFFRGPNIILDGLILYADPANIKSNEGGINMADLMGNYSDQTFTPTEMDYRGRS